MNRNQWRDPGFWRWWWRYRVSPELKVGLAFLMFAVLVGGGIAAAGEVTGQTAAGEGAGPLVQTVTREHVVTVRHEVAGTQKSIVVRPVRVVRRVTGPGRTSYSTQVVYGTTTAPPRTRVVTERDVVAVTRGETVTLPGSTRVVTTPGGTLVRTATVERVVTSQHVVTSERLLTQTVPVTQTVQRVETVRSTDTVTVPVTVPVTVIEENTVTVTVTVRKP